MTAAAPASDFRILCRSCSRPVDADGINLDRMIAKCGACNAVFDFSSQIRRDPAPSTALQRRRPAVPMPSNITVHRGLAGDLDTYRSRGGAEPIVIVRRWFTPAYLGLLFFCIGWDAFLVFWYSIALRGGAWLMVVFPIAHVAIGVGLTYTTLAGLINRTWIAVQDGWLTVRHGPIPWRGNHRLRVEAVKQLFCEQGKGKKGVSFGLFAVLDDGRKLPLVTSVETPDQALFLEQVLEDHLGIEDQEVGGEYRP
jgi:hypothetical protein